MTRPYYEISKITGKTYDLFGVIKIVNARQAAYYVSRGLEIQDIELSEDRKTKEPILVFYFIKHETREPFDEWCKKREAVNNSNEDNGN